MRHLLTHTSGQTTDIWNALTIRYIKAMKLPPVPGCMTEAFRTPLVFDPGEGWEYGVGLDWVGQIVERVSGVTLDDYFKTHIFEPIGMTETSFILSETQKARLIPITMRQPDGSFKATGFQVSQTPEFFMGGAGLYGTVMDYVRFLQMFLNHGMAEGGRVLKPETVDLFFATTWRYGMAGAADGNSVDERRREPVPRHPEALEPRLHAQRDRYSRASPRRQRFLGGIRQFVLLGGPHLEALRGHRVGLLPVRRPGGAARCSTGSSATPTRRSANPARPSRVHS